MYYGTEFQSKVLDAWAFEHGVKLDFIRPGKPVDNCYIESFNARLRDECFNTNVFVSLADARGAPSDTTTPWCSQSSPRSKLWRPTASRAQPRGRGPGALRAREPQV